MDVLPRIERALEAAVSGGLGTGGPPLLGQAVRHAVFTPGSRARPQLLLAVALACGDDAPALSDAAAASLELFHCASLVHDDLPCFDDADTRRGQPTVQRAFGEPLAILSGDGLIVLAFHHLAGHAVEHPERLVALTDIFGRAVGLAHGIVAGQAWECESDVDLTAYHREKTAALFAAATEAGAAAAGCDHTAWYRFGEHLGLAYQVADDLRDVAGDAEEIGKPVGQDSTHDRPSAVAQLGLDGALARLAELSQTAIEAIPECPGAAGLRALVDKEIARLMPPALVDAVGQ